MTQICKMCDSLVHNDTINYCWEHFKDVTHNRVTKLRKKEKENEDYLNELDWFNENFTNATIREHITDSEWEHYEHLKELKIEHVRKAKEFEIMSRNNTTGYRSTIKYDTELTNEEKNMLLSFTPERRSNQIFNRKKYDNMVKNHPKLKLCKNRECNDIVNSKSNEYCHICNAAIEYDACDNYTSPSLPGCLKPRRRFRHGDKLYL